MPRVEHQTAQFPPGHMLDDKYRIERLLAIGGMGAVYVGTHTKIKKRVAIKVLRTELANAQELVERFQREAIAASAIGHDNIVSVTDMGQTDAGVAFLVMEYLEGESLAAVMSRDAPLEVHRACDLAVDILGGVAAAHETGIVHRDLKPENIFLARRSHGDQVKILDFGISRIRSAEDPDHRLTQTGLIMGTPNYMSPEQARGESEITAASDIYSIGVILYEMLTGALPYEAENYNMLMFRVLTGEYVKARARRVDLPEALDRAVNKAMAMAATDRFATADDFAAALAPFTRDARLSRRVVERHQEVEAATTAVAETIAGDAAVAATAPTIAAPSGIGLPGPRRSRALLWVALAAALIGAGVGGLLLFGGSSGGSNTSPGPAPGPAAATETPAPAPAVTPGPAPAPSPPPAPAEVEVTFELTPADATITVDGEPAAGATVRRAKDAVAKVVVSRDGYVADQRQVTFDVKQRIQVVLKRERTGRPRPARPGDGKPPRPGRIITDSPYQ